MQTVHRGVDLLADRKSLAMKVMFDRQADITAPKNKSGMSFAWSFESTINHQEHI